MRLQGIAGCFPKDILGKELKMTNATFSRETAEDRVIVALDCGMDRALELADMLKGHAKWVKVGMTLFYAEGPAAVKAFKDRGFKVFVDLKLHDIPHQVEGAAKSVVLTGADMLTVHASGGQKMMQAAMDGARAAVESVPGTQMPIVLAVTVLTSMDDQTLASIGVESQAAEQVERLAKLADAAGVGGVVCSPKEAEIMKRVLSADKCIVTPGVRPKGSATGDQARVTTPSQAFENGSTHIVVGRPITQAVDPVAAFDAIVDEIVGA